VRVGLFYFIGNGFIGMKGMGKVISFLKFAKDGIVRKLTLIFQTIAIGVVVVIIGLIIEYFVIQPLQKKEKHPTEELEKNKSFPVTIVVSHEYNGAEIYIDDKWVANAPATFPVAKGDHILKVVKDQKVYQEKLLITDKTIRSISASQFRNSSKPSLD
jgi:hypothetical protein